MIVVMSRTCSGKSTFVNMLKKNGLTTYKTYTTRPQRDENDNGYHFVTDQVSCDEALQYAMQYAVQHRMGAEDAVALLR